MSLYSIAKDYIFRPFRFDLFNEGKYYKVIDAKHKYAYDRERNRVDMNKVEGVKLLLQVGLDTQVIETRGEQETGINEGTIIELIVRNGKLEDYQKFVAQGGFTGKEIPVEVFTYDEESVRYFDGNNDRPSLSLVGNIKETKLPNQQDINKVNQNENGSSEQDKQVK